MSGYKVIEGGITAAKGYMAASHAAGIKYKNRTDMALVYCDTPCKAAAVYTSNVVKAAPVLWDKAITDGYTITKSGYAIKTKKSKGEIVDMYALVNITFSYEV